MLDPLQEYLSRDLSSISRQFFRLGSFHKKYSRMPHRTLIPPTNLGEVLYTELLQKRVSRHDFQAQSLSEQQLSDLLYWSVGLLEKESGKERRMHPSGGTKFPIETYIIINNVDSFKQGVYHYRIDTHGLEHLSFLDEKQIMRVFPKQIHDLANTPVLFLLSAIKTRNFEKYGSFAQKLALIECGHIGQNILLTAVALECAGNPFGLGKPSDLNDAMEFDTTNETLYYAVGVGKLPL